jgi:hypothetical protein
MRFTLTWLESAEERLTQLWTDRPDERKQIQRAADDIERRLKHGVERIASLAVGNIYMTRAAPLCVIVEVREQDRLIRVTHLFYEPDA